ncbi:MAG: MraY family glycosyltransferase [Acidobacteriota bacterium]
MIWWCALLVPATAGLVTSWIVPWVTRLARRLDAVDRPSDRKLQKEPVPRLGGVAVVTGIAVAIGLWIVIDVLFGLSLPSSEGDLPANHLARFGFATLAIFLLGVVDDLRGVSVLWKLVVEVAAAWIVIGVGWQIETVRLPVTGEFALGGWAPVISVVWIVGVTNAINLLDGLDGLAGGVVAIVSGSLMGYALLHGGDSNMVLFTCALTGACLGFLRHNWEPARIYLGDSGSLTLGFMLASFALLFSVKASVTVTILVPILALGLPLIDTLLVMAVRFTGRRAGGSFLDRCAGVFKADRQHLHHLALALGPRRSQIVLALHGLVMAFCLMAVLVALRDDPELGIGLLIIEVVAVLSIRKAGLRAQARKLSLNQRAEAKVLLREGRQQQPSPRSQGEPQKLYRKPHPASSITDPG